MQANLALARYSLEMLQALRQRLEPEYCANTLGTLKVFRDRAPFRRAVESGRWLAERGVRNRVLDRKGIVATEPALAPVADRLLGGIHYPDDESGDAHMFCKALADAAGQQGVKFEFGITVQGFRREPDQLSALQTNAGEMQADAFVVAAGSYSQLLLRDLGARLPVRPVKGYSITVPRGKWEDGPQMPVTDDHIHAAVTPMGDRIRVAGTAELSDMDMTVRPSRIRNLVTLLEALYPGFAARLGDNSDLNAWCGLRPVSADGVPVLGPAVFENLYLNTGQGHLGWTMAAGSGKLVADSITGRSPALPLSDYGFQRF